MALIGLTAMLIAPIGLGVPSAAAAGLDWQPCDLGSDTGVTDFECSQFEVPMDHADPSGATFTLAVARHRSTGPADARIGSLFFNPGGPGAPGVTNLPYTWAGLPISVRDRFDLVTWDPRGTGATTPSPTPCSASDTGPVLPPTGPVSLAAAAARAVQYESTVLSACEAANAGIAGYLGTNQVIEDLDDLRVAVGDPGLTYWGVSYGTEIGYAYAAAHPDRVRAIVLDSPMDPSPWSNRRIVDSVDATESAFREFSRFHPESVALFERTVIRLSRQPVRLTSDDVLDRWSAAEPIRLLVSFQSAYPLVVKLIDLMADATMGTRAERAIARPRLARTLTMLQELRGDPWVSMMIFCTDTLGRPDVTDVLPIARRLRRTVSLQAAVEAATSAAMCQGLTTPPDPVPTLVAGAGPVVPLLVIGSSHDGRTNGDWIARMTSAFPSARSITYDGGQHSLYGTVGSTCVDARVTRYLLTTTLPARDTRCPSTYQPGGLVD